MATQASLFNAVGEALSRLGSDLDAAECHGVLCGVLCSLQHHDITVWLAHSFGYQDDIDLEEVAADEVLARLYRQTKESLDAEDFAFDLLLPGDDEPLAERARALGGWCRGFLSGFGLGDSADPKRLSDDCQEFLRDLRDVSKVEADDVDSETDEYAFLEVQEYARMGAMMTRQEIERLAQANQGASAIH